MVKRKFFISRLSLPAPLTLALFALLSYGLLIPWLGLYADDWTFIWTFERLQTPGVLRYFTLGGNRPVWGLFYEIFVPLLGHTPWLWHLFAIFWLWVCAVLVWRLVRSVWPGQTKAALIAGLLFLVYPGMQLQFISLTFGHMWLIYAAFIGSLVCSIQAYRNPRRYLIWSALAVILSAINLLSFEYFIMLEVVRPVLFLIVINQSGQNVKSRIGQTLKTWLPYLLLFISVLIWRSFFFVLQTVRYQFALLDNLRANLWQGLLQLLSRVFGDVFWQTTVRAWGEAFAWLFKQNWTSIVALAVLIIVVFAILIAFFILSRPSDELQQSTTDSRKVSLQMIITGIIALFAGGTPFWMTNLIVEPSWWNSRFTMPFIFGAALLLSGLLRLIHWQRIRFAAAAVLIGFAVGSQFQIANAFRVDWIYHNIILWQLHWRIPGLQVGTTLISNDLPLRYFSDNTLSAELNWIQSKSEPGYHVDNFLGYLSEQRRVGQPIQTSGQQIKRDMISIDFYGSTDQLVGLYYRSGGCLRVLDPRYDPLKQSDDLANAALLTRSDLILPTGNFAELDPDLYGEEPKSDWCYFYEKAELARQTGDWKSVASLGNQFELKPSYLRRDPMLGIVFIEGYVHVGEVDRAKQISLDTLSVRPEFLPVLCQVWQDLKAGLPENLDVTTARQSFGCGLPGS